MDRRLKRPDAGFTLIELMIVVALLAILTTSVSLSASRPRAGVESDVTRFQAVHDRLRAQAILSRQTLGLQLSDTGYQTLRWDGSGWKMTGAEHDWRQEVAVLRPFGQLAPLQFGASGQVTPVEVRFSNSDSSFLCTSNGWAKLSCVAG